VVSQAPLATQVGARVLEQRGNAVDAAVATAFALAVVEPTSSGLGGRTQILIRTESGNIVGIDATTQVPRNYPTDSVPPATASAGYGMIGVPGTVAGLVRALELHGSWPLERVLEPAIELAEHGFTLPAGQARAIASVADHLVDFAGSRSYFLRADGSPYEAGDLFVQRDLARTLREIASSGADAFYRGTIADRIAEDMAAHGGFVTRDDLAAYQARDAMVVRGSYRGYELVGTYLPAAGANSIEMLQILEQFELAEVAGTSEWAAIVAQALLIGFQDRLADLAKMGPPETFPLAANAHTLVAPERAAQRARQILPLQISSRQPGDTVTRAGEFPPGHTTHLSVVDGQGSAVALTQSLGPTLGSKVATQGLGFAYAATMGYLSGDARSAGVRALGPGDRASSRQSPLLVLRNGELRFVLGASGARRILSGIVQVMSRMVDQGLSLEEAMAAPRVHIEPSDPEILHMQVRNYGAWSPEQRADLRAFGFDVRDENSRSFGNVSAIARDTLSGEWIGVADPGAAGAASAPRMASR
jgi:gamma-glutamyltranspeptidase/glutathione hydrolase